MLKAPPPSNAALTGPSHFSVAGTVISAGGAAVTVAGTPVSLATGGVLDVGGVVVTLAAGDGNGNGSVIATAVPFTGGAGPRIPGCVGGWTWAIVVVGYVVGVIGGSKV